MNGQCDTCGQPATHHCSVDGCNHEMCDEHMTASVVSTRDPDHPTRIEVYCPDHASVATATS
jgi:hypothetical protein